MTDDSDNLSLSSAPNLAIQAINKVQTASDKFPSPTLVANTVGPEVVMVEGREIRDGITHEAAGGMRIHAKQEWDEKMVSIPKGLE